MRWRAPRRGLLYSLDPLIQRVDDDDAKRWTVPILRIWLLSLVFVRWGEFLSQIKVCVLSMWQRGMNISRHVGMCLPLWATLLHAEVSDSLSPSGCTDCQVRAFTVIWTDQWILLTLNFVIVFAAAHSRGLCVAAIHIASFLQSLPPCSSADLWRFRRVILGQCAAWGSVLLHKGGIQGKSSWCRLCLTFMRVWSLRKVFLVLEVLTLMSLNRLSKNV